MFLRAKLIRLAYTRPELRPHLMPLFREAAAVNEFSELPQQLRALALAVDKINKRLKKTDKFFNFSNSERKHLAISLRLTGLAVRYLKDAAQTFDTLLPLLPSEGFSSKRANWVAKYFRTFHPLLNKIYRSITGPMKPDETAAAEEVNEALYDLESAASLFRRVPKQLRQMLVRHPDLENQTQLKALINAFAKSLEKADSHLDWSRASMHDLIASVKFGAHLYESVPGLINPGVDPDDPEAIKVHL